MAGLMALMIIIAVVLAKWQTARLVQPINELNLEKPLENPAYEELIQMCIRDRFFFCITGNGEAGRGI